MEELEQPNVLDNGSNEYGKFKDADSLLKAYNNLEAEFTKKSQRLATLECEQEKVMAEQTRQGEIERKVEEFITKFDFAKPFGSALKESLAQDENVSLQEETLKLVANNYKRAEDYAVDDDFLNNYIYSNAEIKNKIVKEYLNKVTQSSPIKVESCSSIPLTPPNNPTTIAEAGHLAKSIIKQK